MFAILLHERMDPFYQNIASFPTAVFTVMLGLCLVYWLGAVLGAFDLDVLDLDGPDLEADLEPTKDYAPNVLAGLLLKLGLNGVPLTIIVSFIALFGWGFSYFAVHILNPFMGVTVVRYAIGLVVLIGAAYLAALVTSVAIRPLRKLFKTAERNDVKYLLGQTAIVRSGEVDASFGEATLADGGAGLLLKVRARDGATFVRGDRVVLLDYNADANTYLVIPESEFSGD